jgi:hypothetical protein
MSLSAYIFQCLSFSLHRTELFHHASGARENAVKILVVITDGEKYGDPLDYEDVIPQADRAGVIRYVIGVGNVAPRSDASVDCFYLDEPPFSLQMLVKSKRSKTTAS